MPRPASRATSPAPLLRRRSLALPLALTLALILPLAPPGCTVDDSPNGTATSPGTTAGSSGADTRKPAQLVAADAWFQLDAATDPYADHRPETVECGLGGIFVDEGELDIDTNLCNYVTLEQPGLAEVRAGDTLTLVMRHFDLAAPEPATAHVALLLDGTLAWERTLLIPGPAEVISVDIDAPIDLPIGEPARFHLHNHGQNTWILTGITVTP